MRAVRTLLAAAWLLGVAPLLASAQQTPAKLLGWRPSQPGIEYDTPTDPAAIQACKIEHVEKDRKAIGYMLRDGQGKILRRYVDTSGDGKLDQWSYYQDGFEVFRDIDLDGDLHVDECRWLNMAGTRHATIAKSKITGWKQLSAEEASKVLVQALVSADADLIETVMATPKELAALGIPRSEVDRVAAAAAQRTKQVNALLKELSSKGWDKSSVWQRFDGTMPHAIPVDAGSDLKADLTLYENAVIFAGQPNGQGNPASTAYLQANEMVKVGETWKFIDLPRAIDPQKPLATLVQEGGIRAALFREAGAPAQQNPELAAAIQALANYDNQHAADLATAEAVKIARYHRDRIPMLRAIVKLVAGTPDELNFNRQIVDSLASAYQTGLFPDGMKLIEAFIESKGKIGSYAAFKKIMAENGQKVEQPGANLIKLQEELMKNLEEFLARYDSSDEAPDALYQLASINEFNGEEEKATKYYQQLASKYPDADTAKKAAGALRRLALVGKPLLLKGKGLNDETIDVDRLRGKVVLVVFWATWADPAKRDLPELNKLLAGGRGKGLELLGVNLDTERGSLDAYLRDNPVSWPQVFEPGGMDSRLANEFGIISLPTMFLVDKEGKVQNRSLRTAQEVEKQLEKLGLGKVADVARTPK